MFSRHIRHAHCLMEHLSWFEVAPAHSADFNESYYQSLASLTEFSSLTNHRTRALTKLKLSLSPLLLFDHCIRMEEDANEL